MAEILKAQEQPPQQQQAPKAPTHTNVPRTVWKIRTPWGVSANDGTYDDTISAASDDGVSEWGQQTIDTLQPPAEALVRQAAQMSIWDIIGIWAGDPKKYATLIQAMKKVREAANDATHANAA